MLSGSMARKPGQHDKKTEPAPAFNNIVGKLHLALLPLRKPTTPPPRAFKSQLLVVSPGYFFP